MRIRHLLLLFLCTSLSCAVFYACRKDASYSKPQQITESVSFKQALEIFNYASAEVGQRFENRYRYIVPRWDIATPVSLGLRNNSLYVPLAYDTTSGNYLQLLVMKDEGRVRSLLIEIQPDRDWLVSHNSLGEYHKVTGKLLFYSINGRFHQGYVMKDGGMVKEYTPEQELGSLSALLKLNSISATGSTNADPCTYGTFGCQELAEVKVVAYRPSSSGVGEISYVYINIPSTVYNSNPNGGYYSGYNWFPTGGSTTPVPSSTAGAPGDRLCQSSFNFLAGNQNSFYVTNMSGLQFEQSETMVNVLPWFKISLANEISDVAMNSKSSKDFFGSKKTRLEYLRTIFPTLMGSNIYQVTAHDGVKAWYFTPYAAATIAAYCTNLGAKLVVQQLGVYASYSGNSEASTALGNQSTMILDAFMANSEIKKGFIEGATLSYASYSPTCK